MNILVMAYAISPYRGSEYAVAWNYVTHMSKENNLTVLFGTSDNHIGETDTMNKYLEEHPVENVRFIAVKPNGLTNILNWPNRHNLFVYTFYYAFAVWQRTAYNVAKEIIKTEHFDLVHNVGPIGYREPGYLWKLSLPYIWGPVGGANNAPLQLMKHMPLIGRMKQTFRNVANTMQFHTKLRLKRALRATDVLLTATSENQRKFKEVHHKDSICIPENCITGKIALDESKFDNPSKYNIIVIGTLDARKSVGIFLEALEQVRNRNMLHVDIVGDGPLRTNLQEYAKKHGLDRLIAWHGHLPRAKAVKIFNSAHLHVITSVSEGNPTTIWEAMSYGVPTMSFDHCGMHDTTCGRCGIRVPIAKRYEDCVAGIARNINELLEHPEHFYQLAHGVLECAKRYTWNEREKLLNEEIYVMAIENHKHIND